MAHVPTDRHDSEPKRRRGLAEYIVVMGHPLPCELCWWYYAVSVFHRYHDTDGGSSMDHALCAFGKVVVDTAEGVRRFTPHLSPVLLGLAEEAKHTIAAIASGEVMPEPKAAGVFLASQPSPQAAHVRAICLFVRIKLLGIKRCDPDHVVMVPGPLQDAARALNPVACPLFSILE